MGKLKVSSILLAIFMVNNVRSQLISASSGMSAPPPAPEGMPAIPAMPEPKSRSQSSTSSSSVSQTSASFSKGSIAAFSGQFFDALAPKASPNFVASPFSVETCMSQLYCGAAGKTAKIMQRLIFINGTATNVANEYQQLLKPWHKTNSNVHIANSIFIRNGYQVQTKFQQLSQNDFYSSVQSVNFANQIAAAKQINNFVANETNNQITSLLKPKQITSDTTMILVNTLHFKGQWQNMFSKRSTALAPFITGGDCKTSTASVQMMNQERFYNFGYISYLESHVIELPFNNYSAVSMYIYLPRKCDGIDNLEQKLKHYNPDWMYYMDLQYTKVVLSLPKFRVESSFDLKDALTTLGVADIFNPRLANFDRLAKQGSVKENLYVGQILHKAVIDVNEIGVEASAATAVRMLMGAAFDPNPPTIFNVNRPFVFTLATPTNVLFVGRYTMPNSS